MNETKDRAEDQARAQVSGIVELVEALHTAQAKGTAQYEGDEMDEDAVRERMRETPLSLEVRSAWHTPGADVQADEYQLLLCTGGPAVRIRGDLSRHCEPDSCTVEYQDWATPWTEYGMSADEEKAVLEFCQTFYYGD